MIYARNEEHYQQLYTDFQACTENQRIKDFFNKNWDAVKEEWRIFYIIYSLGNTTNNRNKGVNNAIKLFMGKENSLELFFENFFIFYQSQEMERDKKINNMIAKRPFFEISNNKKWYWDFSTSWAFKKVSNELDRIDTVNHVQAFSFLKNIIDKSKASWICHSCESDLYAKDSIGCDTCMG